jgi:oxygen-independent coproporphyrinogen-3 oxidase
MINDFLEKSGYKRYEISNFAVKGYESRHNLNYWNNSEYYGFGAAAHGYINNIRYSNISDVEKYMQEPLNHSNEHFVTQKEKLEEEIFLGFRKEAGIDVASINKKFNIHFDEKYKDIITKHSPKYLTKTNYGYKLTLEGVLLSNNILADFID